MKTIYCLVSVLLSQQWLVVSAQEDVDDFSGGTCTETCDEPGKFCGKDGLCHPFSCSHFWEYGDPKLTGFVNGTELQCFGYNSGRQDNLHGVSYGCEPPFPGAAVLDGQQVSYPFNERCTAERDGYSYVCYQFLENSTATSFDSFQQEATSLFPSCENGANPQYYAPIVLSAHYLGAEEGLQGPGIVSSGTETNGHTYLQTNSMEKFDEKTGMVAMYVDVTAGPRPAGETSGVEDLDLNADPGQSNVHNNDNGGGGDDSSATTKSIFGLTASVSAILLLVGMD
jgi:hypothetical protein